MFSKIIPSFFTIKEGVFSTSPSLLQGELHILTKPPLLRKEGCNRPTRCSEPLRSKDGGPIKGLRHGYAGWDRLAIGGNYLRNCLAYEGYNDYMMLVLW